ncbi:DUF3307 domain-containing protein [Candidatus Peregrinibacteria bacterium]|nr:DUF3307 domain-containing protein [Candidatus Peregrinibacteria bacterium]
MNLLFHFFLIHFLADYPLQPNKLVQMKKKGYLGVLLHCCVHLATLLVVLMPFLGNNKVLVGIAVIFVTHNIIDQTKIALDKKYPKCRLYFYLLDQFTHLVIVTSVAFYIGTVSMPSCELYSNQSVVLYALVLILSTFFYDVTAYFIKTRNKPAPYKRNYKLMYWNAIIATIGFMVYWLAY